MTIPATDSAARTFRSDDHHDASRVQTRPTTPQQGVTARYLERLAPTGDYLAFLASVPVHATVAVAVAARDSAIQSRLDGVRDAFSGPYLVAGASVTARPMFRMFHPRSAAIVTAVQVCAKRAGVSAGAAIVGQPTPAQLTKITQALIDGGCLPAGPGDVATRIRQMQWSYGIGVDCAGYAKQAILATAPHPPKLYDVGIESFRDLDGKRASSFARHPLADARPGDLVTLDAIAPEIYGHNVVVYSHVTADAKLRGALANEHGAAVREFLGSAGPHHVLQVDSSWGAGNEGNDWGGFRRDTWIYDDATKRWGSFDPRSQRFQISTRGPSGDAYHATYRSR